MKCLYILNFMSLLSFGCISNALGYSSTLSIPIFGYASHHTTTHIHNYFHKHRCCVSDGESLWQADIHQSTVCTIGLNVHLQSNIVHHGDREGIFWRERKFAIRLPIYYCYKTYWYASNIVIMVTNQFKLLELPTITTVQSETYFSYTSDICGSLDTSEEIVELVE